MLVTKKIQTIARQGISPREEPTTIMMTIGHNTKPTSSDLIVTFIDSSFNPFQRKFCLQ